MLARSVSTYAPACGVGVFFNVANSVVIGTLVARQAGKAGPGVPPV
jgi:hypothetical protein